MTGFDPLAIRPPDMPRPRCRTTLVAGPPASGKTTFARTHMRKQDILIDFEAIAADMGWSRAASRDHVPEVLAERNRRLRSLADADPRVRAYICLLAPSRKLRIWWQLALTVDTTVVLNLPMHILRQRIMADPDRRGFEAELIAVAEDWHRKEKANDPGFVYSGCDENGEPLDPLHPWA